MRLTFPGYAGFQMRVPRPSIGGVGLFPAFAAAGAFAACALAIALAKRRGLEVPFIAVLAIATAAAQAVFGMAASVALRGRNRLVLYHRSALFVAVATAVCLAAGRSPRPWLDAITPPLFLFVTFGRLGCWAAGCCYGRPSRFGFMYSEEHAEAIAPGLLKLPLFPVQLVDATVALAVATAGSAGVDFLTCFGMYSGARFFLEYVRGEPGRGRFGGLTEAQWTSFAIAGVVWPVSAMALGAIALCYRPLSPDDIVQLAHALSATRIHRVIATTSFGVTVTREAGEIRLLSTVPPRIARRLAALDGLICRTQRRQQTVPVRGR